MAGGVGFLINVLITVESGGDNWAVGDQHLTNKAYGPLQIRQPVCDDYNRVHGTSYQATMMKGNRELSRKICLWYLRHYGRREVLGHTATAADYARIWNGGPGGWRQPGTRAYWAKVRAAMVKASSPKKERRSQKCGRR